MSLVLHHDHLADLQKSGLSEASIAAAHIRSVAPGTLEKQLGKKLAARVEHAYEIPYHTLDGAVNGFSRLKLFPYTDQALDVRYWQEPNSRAHLYMSTGPDWATIASDATIPIHITEGEKKGLAASQCGLHTLAIGGCWNFRTKLDGGERIMLPELDLFVWKDRPVTLIPDSDGWRASKLFDVLAGFFALAMELTSRGARVVFVRLPDLPGLAKTGLDDWLVREGIGWRDAWAHLERVGLDDPRLHAIVKWWQDWRERQATENAIRHEDAEALELEETSGLYRVRWAKHAALMTFDRVADARGGVGAELTVTLGQTKLLGETDVSLKSDSSRDKIARTLKGFTSEIPWKRLLERACTAVLARHRDGEPIIVLEPTASVDVPFLLNPFIYDEHPALFYAPGGSLKSYLALYLALLASHGGGQNGLGAIACPVVYLDWELNAPTVGGRLTALRTGHPELSEFVPYYRRCEQPLYLEVARIAQHVAAHGVRLLILDSAAMACGGDLNSPDTVIKLTRVLRTIGCSSLLLAHISKVTPEGQERTAYGSVFFRELARNVWELERAEGDGPVRVLLTHRKNNFGPLHAPMAFEFAFVDKAVRVVACDPNEEPDFEHKLPLASRIRNLLEDGKLRTSEQVAEALSANLGTVRVNLSRGKKVGKWSMIETETGAQWTVNR